MIVSCIKICLRFSVLMSLAFGLTGCTGTVWPSATEMLQNIAESMPQVLQLVSAAAYVFGIACILKGVYKLREYGELRTMMSSNTSIMPTLVMFCVGAALLYFPSAYQIGLQTVFAYSNPLTYSSVSGVSSDLSSALFQIVQVIGGIAFIRGLLMLNSVTGQGSQPGMFSKAVTHVVGGLCAINLWGTFDIISNTLTGN